jgi:hypothetical protein
MTGEPPEAPTQEPFTADDQGLIADYFRRNHLGSGAGRPPRLHDRDRAAHFVDVAIQRWQAFSRKDAIHAASGLSFDELASQRAEAIAPHSAPGAAR